MCVHLSLTVFISYCVSLVFRDPLNSDLVRSLGIRQGPGCLLLILFLLFFSHDMYLYFVIFMYLDYE